MSFYEAVSSVFLNYVGFTGRASRSEYWYWVLFTVVVTACLTFVDQAFFPSWPSQPITSVFGLATLLPSLAVGVRRLHDIDRTGWWLLLMFTIIGALVLIIWFCMLGTRGPNRFGDDPLAGTAS